VIGDLPTFNLYLIRHAQSEVNARGGEVGQDPKTPLTEKGKIQARLLGQRLRSEIGSIDCLFSSDYSRAIQTAEIIKQQMGKMEDYHSIFFDQDLREYNAGDWTGRKRKETLTPEVRLRMGYLNHSFTPPNGESLNQVERRVARWLDEKILTLTGKDLNIVAVSHGMTIKTILHYIMGFDKSMTWKIEIDNTSITKLSFGEVGWRVFGINDCGHLLGTK
jgi:probable phosphoglycerate mutase